MARIQKVLPFVRHYVALAVYDVLEGERLPYQKLGDALAVQMEGQPVIVQVTDGCYGTSLCITSPDGAAAQQVAERLADRVATHLNDELLRPPAAQAEAAGNGDGTDDAVFMNRKEG